MSETLDFYANNAADFINRTTNLNLSALYADFLPFIPAGGSILDAGCGSGRDSRYFINQGYTVHAFDAVAEITRQASSLIDKTVEVATFENFRSDNKYDGIWACASLLHVPPDHLPDAIDNLAFHLRSGGAFYMSFKYGNGQRIHGIRHFTDMDESGLKVLTPRISALTLKKTWTTEDLRPERSSEKWLNAIWIK